jgi:phosphoadenosine phosphosulfate reductase
MRSPSDISTSTDQWPPGAYDPVLDALFKDYVREKSGLNLSDLLHDPRLGKIALVSSFGTESAVLIHVITSVTPDIPIIFIDTLKHFPETLDYVETLTSLLKLNVIRVTPDERILKIEDSNNDLVSTNPDQCCMLRKTFPLADAMVKYDSWISGRKRFQGASRAAIPLLERDGEKIKLNPLAFWQQREIDIYFKKHGLPSHPLKKHRYLSVGCAPCTKAVAKGADPREGRWADTPDKTECGIHLGPDGRLVRKPVTGQE